MSVAAIGSAPVVVPQRAATPAGVGRPFSEVLATVSPPAPRASQAAQNLLRSLGDGQRRLDEIVARARSGRAFSPRELLALQAEVYRISEETALVQRVVEEGLSGIKRLWTMQL